MNTNDPGWDKINLNTIYLSVGILDIDVYSNHNENSDGNAKISDQTTNLKVHGDIWWLSPFAKDHYIPYILGY